jgi:putative FmdB family regulatory protein
MYRMPTYEFQCSSCKEEVELNLPMSIRDNDHSCEHCGGPLVRLLTACGKIVRGENRKGFYNSLKGGSNEK